MYNLRFSRSELILKILLKSDNVLTFDKNGTIWISKFRVFEVQQ